MKTKIMVLCLFMKDIIMRHNTKWWFTEIIQQNTFPWLKKFTFSSSNNDDSISTAFLSWQPKYQYSQLLPVYEGLIYEWFECKRTVFTYLDLEYCILYYVIWLMGDFFPFKLQKSAYQTVWNLSFHKNQICISGELCNWL